MAADDVGVLKRLLDTGEYSDFTISTPDKDLKVHRNILCVKSAYFRTACAGEFQEAQSSRIEIEEPSWVIEALLGHLYEQPHERPSTSCDASDTLLLKDCERAMQILIAADKYQISGLTGPKFIIVRILYQLKSPQLLASLCSRLLGNEFPQDPYLLKSAAEATVVRLDIVLADSAAWKVVYENERYVRSVVEIQKADNEELQN